MTMFQPFVVFGLCIHVIYGVHYITKNQDRIGIWYRKNKLLIYPFIGLIIIYTLLLADEAHLAISGKTFSFVVALLIFVYLLFNSKLTRRTRLLVVIIFVIVDALLTHHATAKLFTVTRPLQLGKFNPPDFEFNMYRKWVINTPLILSKDFSRRYYNDHTFSLAEPFLLYKDSAYFVDNLRWFIMKDYYQFLQRKVKAEYLKDDLGITAPKIQIVSDGLTKSSHVTKYNSNEIEIEVSPDKKASLIYLDTYHENWYAYLDGTEVPIRRWKGIFKKVDFDKGKHVIEFKFKPTLFLCGFYSLYFSYLVLPLSLLYKRLRPLMARCTRYGQK
jgi:hypothetical protein